ncbi:MAG: ABC transporter permease [Firmicutes bacterium]|nr:ABC transporter permease [Bacillota bacterium]
MKPGKLSLKLIKYELFNIASNVVTFIFGVVFPIGLALLFSFVLHEIEGADTQLFITMAMIIPLATMLIGHATSYANELESGAVLRLRLFGFKDKTLLIAKLIANMIFLTICFSVYCLVLGLALDVTAPSVGAVFTYIIFFYLFSIIVFLLAHGIATLCGRFGLTFGIAMALYFGLMILGGNMGIQPNQMPDGMRHIAMGLPLYYISANFADFWNGGTFDWLPFILTTFAFAVICVLLVVLAFYLTKKGKINQKSKPVYYD